MIYEKPSNVQQVTVCSVYLTYIYILTYVWQVTSHLYQPPDKKRKVLDFHKRQSGLRCFDDKVCLYICLLFNLI